MSTRMVAVSTALAVAGIALEVVFLWQYIADGFSVDPPGAMLSHLALTGLFLVGLGFIMFTTMLVVQAIAAQFKRRGE